MMTLSVPGKTFLVGEYVALAGGPSLVLATSPRFVLKVTSTDDETGVCPFNPPSPGGKLWARSQSIVKGHQFEFVDPHAGKGGLGASSAQFALLYAWLLKSKPKPEELSWDKLLADFRDCAWDGEGAPPSGADVVAQLTGGICWFDGQQNIVDRHGWPFKNLGFTLIRTGSKLATHEYLKQDREYPNGSLRAAVESAYHAILSKSDATLLAAVKKAAAVLKEAGLCALGTQTLLDALEAEKVGALAAKGCGAMGADVIVVIHEKSSAKQISAWAERRGLSLCGTDADLTYGLRIDT